MSPFTPWRGRRTSELVASGATGCHKALQRHPSAMLTVVLAAMLSNATVPPAAGALPGNRPPVLQPPAITEDFKPVIACNLKTTAGQEGCGEHTVLTDDALLNADVKVMFGLLSGEAARRDFVTAQADWLAYRNADCKSQSDAYEGGTEQPVVYVYCLATDDSSRRQELKEFYKVLTQGLDNAPKFP